MFQPNSKLTFWLSNEAWAATEPHLPKNQPGARRVDDRRVISEIVHMLQCGPLDGLPCRLRPDYDGLQPLEPMKPPRHLDPHPLAVRCHVLPPQGLTSHRYPLC